MMRLNNKGFAVSTILYGILSLTIIILMMIFGLMKSSKDMNQELVESIEGHLNNCVLSEVELEECYFDGGSCNYQEYNSCTGREVETKLLYSVAQEGDFVNYDAGYWPATVDTPNQLYAFGGYKGGASRNNSVNCTSSDHNKYNGWRVYSITDNVVELIHAGTSECYYQTSNNNDGYRSIHYLTGTLLYSDAPSRADPQVYDWSYYVDSDYATKARMLESWDNSEIYKINSSYFLAGMGVCDHHECIKGGFNGAPDNATGRMGIRPIVTLKEDVKTMGSVINTYGKKEWILVK